MILIRRHISRHIILGALLLVGGGPLVAQHPGPTIRRLAATALLAAQEYRLGVFDGQVVSAPEVEEATMFLREAIRLTNGLPAESVAGARAQLEDVLQLVAVTGLPDTVAARVQSLVTRLGLEYGVEVDEIPTDPPLLARGAEVYQTECASCHGVRGTGDGLAGAGLNPSPADLTDAGALANASPLDFYRRITIGVAGTAMPSFEARLSAEDRWAAAVYASVLRLPAPEGRVPVALTAFPTTARMTDAEVRAALGTGTGLAGVAAVRAVQASDMPRTRGALVFNEVRRRLDTAFIELGRGATEEGRQRALDAYIAFERVEREVRAKDPGLAGDVETAFAAARSAPGALPASAIARMRGELFGLLERAERAVADRPSGFGLVTQSFILLVREGLEAILIVGALLAFLARTGAANRRRDIHVGVGVAIGASLLTALALETIFRISPAQQEALEGLTMILATGMLFYVSYWLLSKMEVAKWNKFVRGRIQEALTSGSALALASVAFLAVYREGFETVLFYKALFVSGGAGAWAPIATGAAGGLVVLAVAYVAIHRFGVKLPLKPFFGITSAFLYYMAFVFAGKGVADLQEGGLIATTVIGGPRLPALGIYPTLESMSAQALLLAFAIGGILWTFVIEPRRRKVTQVLVPEPNGAVRNADGHIPLDPEDRGIVRSLDRIDTDLAEIRDEVERIRRSVRGGRGVHREG